VAVAVALGVGAASAAPIIASTTQTGITIDGRPPHNTISQSITGGSAISGVVHWEATTSGETPNNVRFFVDGEQQGAQEDFAPWCAQGDAVCAIDTQGLTNGRHVFKVESRNAAGKVLASNSRKATVNNQEPPLPPPPPSPPPPPPPTPLFDGGFDTGNLSQWDGAWNASRISALTSSVGVTPRQGSHMGRFEVRAGDTAPWGGSEAVMVYRSNNIPGHYDVYGADRYTGFSMYLPAGFPYVPNQWWNIFFEWHGDNNSQSPFKIIVDSIIRPGNPSVSFAAELNYGSVSSPTKTIWRLGDLITGQWVDFVVRVKWHLTEGIVQVWMNDNQIVNANGINTWYTSGQTNVKPQLGYYRPMFSQTAIFYLDAFKVGNSYESVAPGG
jgi:hypothetical protein